MADPTPATSDAKTNEAQTPIPDEAAQPTPDAGKHQAEGKEIDWKGEARKWEDRAKANAEKAKKLDEIEQANKSELEKAQERAAKAEAEAKAAKAEALRADVAASKGVPMRLVFGETRADMEASADEAIAWRSSAEPKTPKAPSSTHAGKQGEDVGAGDPIVSRDQLKSMTPAQILQARKDGRLDGLMGA